MLPNKERDLMINFPYKIAEIDLSCQLFKSQLQSDNEIKSNCKQNEKFKIADDEVYYKNICNSNIKKEIINENQVQNVMKVMENTPIDRYDEIKIDCDDILVLYLKITDLNPIIIDKALDPENYRRNYYISHKVFPNRDISSSDIMWNSLKTDFNYQMLMPFSLNSKTIDLIDNGLFLIELWNKGNNTNELLGISKLELSIIMDSLRIGEDLISITPISKSLFPLIICDGYQPVYNYDEMGNICYLNITLGLGTTTQINNFIKKNQTQGFKHGKKDDKFEINKNNDYPGNPSEHYQDINHLREEGSKRSVEVRKNQDEEINEINNLLNNNSNFNQSSKNQVNVEEEVDVEEILERNRKELEQLNYNKFKNTGSSINESKKYEGNPFLVTNRDKLEKEKEKDETFQSHIKQFAVSKESNFYINDKELTKFTYNDFYNSKKQKIHNSSIPDFNSLCIVEKDQISYIPNNQVKSPTFNEAKSNTFKITPDKINPEEQIIINKNSDMEPTKETSLGQVVQNKVENFKENLESDIKTKQNNNINIDINNENNKFKNNRISNQGYRHTFEIFLDKIYNLQVLAKVKNSYLRYKFLNDEKESIKSDILFYTSYDKDTSIIDIDMKSSHSLFVSDFEKIKDYLQDFTIELVSNSTNPNEEIIFGRISLPSEEFLSLIGNNPPNSKKEDYFSNKYCSTIFIYGTDKIKREDCIIGKMKLEIKYERVLENVEEENSLGNIFMERGIIFDRKIPKNATLAIRLNYFRYDQNFLHSYDLNSQAYYFIIDPFGEDKNHKKIVLPKKSVIKGNTLNGLFEEDFYFDLVMEKEILEYFKNKNLLVDLMFSNNLTNNLDYLEKEKFSNDDSDDELKNFVEKIGTAKIKLSEVIINSDYSYQNFNIISSTSNSILGKVNLDIKLENSNLVPYKNKEKKKYQLDNLKSILNEKNSRKLEGKFFFVLNFYELLVDDSFLIYLNNLNEYRKSIKKNTKVFFMFKFGKSYKKVSQVINLNENLTELFNIPKILKRNLNFFEIMELDISFSKNKQNNVLKQLMENIFEIKLFLKTDEENENLGSFVIDLSQLLQSKSKISENIYHSDTFNCYCYKFEDKTEKTLKVSFSISLIKSDSNFIEFKDFYENMKINFGNIENWPIIKEICTGKNMSMNANELKKLFVIIKKENNFDNDNIKDYYSYVDMHLIDLEDNYGKILKDNLLNVIRLFMRNYNIINHISNSDEFFHDISEIFGSKKLNLKNSCDTSINRYILSREKLLDVLRSNNTVRFDQLNKLIDCYDSFLSEKNQTQFSVYACRKDSTYDLFDLILDFAYIYNVEEEIHIQNTLNNYNRSILLNKNIPIVSTCCVSIIVFSGTNLTISQPLSQKPNSYFVFSWGNDECTSDRIVNTAHPSWNKKIDIRITNNPDSIQSKLNKEINFKFYSNLNSSNIPSDISHYNSYSKKYKQTIDDNPYNLNRYSQSTLDPNQEFIGKLKFNLNEMIKYNFFNKNGEYEGYFNIVNQDKIRGQVNLKFIIDQKLLSKNNQISKSENLNDLNSDINYLNNTNKGEYWDRKINTFNYTYNHHSNNSVINLNSNNLLHQEIETLDYKELWEKLNDNTETIRKLTNEIDKFGLDRGNIIKKKIINTNFPLNLESTIERERRISEKYDLDVNVDNMNIDMDFEDEQLIERNYQNLKNFSEKVEENKEKNEGLTPFSSEKVDDKGIILDNILSDSQSINVEVDNLDKAYSFSALPNNIEYENVESEKKNHNQSMLESFNKKEKSKRPPIPTINNLYKTADKNFLKKIQKILKNKESRKLNYASSDGEDTI